MIVADTDLFALWKEFHIATYCLGKTARAVLRKSIKIVLSHVAV
jgi:hypothetical protein